MKYLSLLALWLFMACGAQATVPTSQSVPPILQLSANQPDVSSTGAWSLFRTSTTQDDPEQALRTATWQPLPGELNLGYSHDIVWLKLTVARDAAAPSDWVLNLGNALFDDVQVFYRSDSGSGNGSSAGIWMHLHAGENVPRDAWPMDARNVAFPLTLPEGEATLLVRIQSKNAFTSSVDLRQRVAYNNASRRDTLYQGLYFGGFLFLLVMHGFFWRITREKQSGWYLLYVTLTASIQLLTAGIPQWILRIPVEISDPLLGCCICVGLIVGTKFAMLQLELEPVYPQASRYFLRFIILVCLPSAALILAGRYGAGSTLVQLAALTELVVMVGTAIYLLSRGHKPAQFFVFVFGIYYATIAVSFFRNQGWVPSNTFTANIFAIGTLIHLLATSMRLHFQFNVLRQKTANAQYRAAQAMRKLNEGLEAEVAVRTVDLQQEIERRKLLENELRAALATEQRLKEEQRSFVAMVSHEFRTPLAIINVTAQQIARNAGAAWSEVETRCQNLRDTVRRMTDLVDGYLSADRMDASVFSPRPYNVPELVDELVPQWPQGRVVVTLKVVPEPFVCDPSLLKIALQNLLANADRHAPPGDTITLCARAEVQDLKNGLRFDVSNGGEPIPPEEAPRLFQKYFRGRMAQQRTGAGLGLHLVQQIAGMHGGTAWLESVGQNGLITFSLWIPA